MLKDMEEDKGSIKGTKSITGKLRDFYLGLTISRKILLGYMIMALLLIITSLYNFQSDET